MKRFGIVKSLEPIAIEDNLIVLDLVFLDADGNETSLNLYLHPDRASTLLIDLGIFLEKVAQKKEDL